MLLPVTVRFLSGQDRGDGVGGHGRSTTLRDIGLISRTIEQLPQGQVPNRGISTFEQPFERVRTKGRMPTDRPHVEHRHGAGRR